MQARDPKTTDLQAPVTRAHLAGFTLLEVLVAVSVLGIAIAVVLQLFSANLRAISTSGDYVKAVETGEAKMREILDDEALTERSSSETTNDGYRIDVSVSRAMQKKTENLPVMLLDISLAVHWTKGSKERTVNLRTMKMVQRKV